MPICHWRSLICGLAYLKACCLSRARRRGRLPCSELTSQSCTQEQAPPVGRSFAFLQRRGIASGRGYRVVEDTGMDRRDELEQSSDGPEERLMAAEREIDTLR